MSMHKIIKMIESLDQQMKTLEESVVSEMLPSEVDSLLQDFAQTIGGISYQDIYNAHRTLSQAEINFLSHIAHLFNIESDDLKNYFEFNSDGNPIKYKGRLKSIIGKISKNKPMQ